MAKETEVKCADVCVKTKWHHHDKGMGGVYFLGIIGVAVYFIQQVSGFWPIVLAILKAIVWPAFLIYQLFVLLKI